jgi:hypothetical protein
MPLGRPRRRWEDNIKMDVQEVGGGRGDWIELVQDRDRWRALVSTVKNLWVPLNAGNFLVSCENWSASQEGLCSMEYVLQIVEFGDPHSRICVQNCVVSFGVRTMPKVHWMQHYWSHAGVIWAVSHCPVACLTVTVTNFDLIPKENCQNFLSRMTSCRKAITTLTVTGKVKTVLINRFIPKFIFASLRSLYSRVC